LKFHVGKASTREGSDSIYQFCNFPDFFVSIYKCLNNILLFNLNINNLNE